LNKWYSLDNAAKLFPSVTNVKNSSVFRVSAVLTEAVDKEFLQRAVEHIYDRFPMLFVQMHKGVFWNYFDNNVNKFYVQEETEYPCEIINPVENNGYFIRVMYYNNRISVEAFHSLTDGSGAIEFLKTILFYYFNFSEYKICDEGKIILADDEVSDDEMEDSFYENGKTNDKKVNFQIQKESRPFRIRGTAFEAYGNSVIAGVISANDLNKLAKTKNATITSYLVAVLLYSIYTARQKYAADKKPITVCVPVNLRKFFQSKTLRNFFTTANIRMRIDNTTKLETIIEEVTAQLKRNTEKPVLRERILYNMRFENSIFSRFLPLLLKKILIKIGYSVMGGQTISLSNLGNISVPSGFSTRISLIEAVLYPTPKSPLACGVCSVNDRLVLSFSRTIVETDIIKYFFNHLSERDGLDVSVYSNDWGKGNDKVQ